MRRNFQASQFTAAVFYLGEIDIRHAKLLQNAIAFRSLLH